MAYGRKKLPPFRLSELEDVSIVDPTNGETLTYDATTGKWTDKAAAVGSLNDIGDVSISSPSAGHYLRYDGSNWVNSALQAADLPSHTHAWADVDKAGSSVNDLEDVSISSPADGEVLTYNASTGKWENKAAAGGADPFDLSGNYFPVEVANASGGTSGSGTINNSYGILYIYTGTTANSYAIASARPLFVGYTKETKLRLYIQRANVSANGRILVYMIADSWDPDAATKYIGIRITSGSVLFVSKDGTTESTVDVTADFGDIAGGIVERDIIMTYTPATEAKLYINGSLKATITTNLPPSDDTSTQNYCFGARVDNNEDTENNYLWCSNAHAYRAI